MFLRFRTAFPQVEETLIGREVDEEIKIARGSGISPGV